MLPLCPPAPAPLASTGRGVRFETRRDALTRVGLEQADSSVTDPQTAADLKKKRTFRTFSYRGVELDKLLDLSNEEVRPLVV